MAIEFISGASDGKRWGLYCCLLLFTAGMIPTQDAALAADYTLSDIAAGMASNMAGYETFTATYRLNSHDPKVPPTVEKIGWKQVAGSGYDRFDKRYIHRSTPVASPEVAGDVTEHWAHDGQTSWYLTVIPKPQQRLDKRGTVTAAMNGEIWGRGLSLAQLAGFHLDLNPLPRIVGNGATIIESVTHENGRSIIIIYGVLTYAGLPDAIFGKPNAYVRLFIDPNQGFMPIRQEHYAVTGDPIKNRRLFATYTAEFAELKPNVWFPMSGAYVTQGGTTELKVEEVQLGADIPDEFFRITTWPPGTKVEDRVKGVSFTMPDYVPKRSMPFLSPASSSDLQKDFADLEKTIAAERDIQSARSRVVTLSATTDPPVDWKLISIYAGAVLAAGAGYAAMRAWRNRSS